MANTLPGTPYVESSDLVANYPAVSESLAERVDLVGILPFATSTARGTALPTPTDGQYTYLQDTNSTEFWNGSAWQSAGIDPGLQIVAPTSIANSGGSASASGGAVTFTGVSSVSLNGVFTSAYDNYLIQISATADAGRGLNMRLRAAGTDNSSNNYKYGGFYTRTVTSAAYNGSYGAGLGNLWALGDTSTEAGQLTVTVYDPATTKHAGYSALATGNYATNDGYPRFQAGNMSVTTAYDGFTFSSATGNITGTIRVYGYKNS